MGSSPLTLIPRGSRCLGVSGTCAAPDAGNHQRTLGTRLGISDIPSHVSCFRCAQRVPRARGASLPSPPPLTGFGQDEEGKALWKTPILSIQTLPGQAFVAKSTGRKLPWFLPLYQPQRCVCTTVIVTCSCSPAPVCFYHPLLSLCIVLLIHVLATHVELPFFDRMSECDILYILKYLPYLYTICYC